MKLSLASKSILLGFFILLLSLLYNYRYVWNTANSNGGITYIMQYYGLPFQYLYQELSSPVGPSSYFKVSAEYFIIDLIFWSVIAGAIISLISRYHARRMALTG